MACYLANTESRKTARVVTGLLAVVILGVSVGSAKAADDNLPQSSYAFSTDVDAQNTQSLSFDIDQNLVSENQFLLSGGRTRVPLTTGNMDGYSGSMGMSTDPNKPYSYGASVNMAYLGPTLKSQSVTGSWSYASDTWMFVLKPTVRTIVIYVPSTSPPTNAELLGAGTSIAMTRFFGQSWGITGGAEYYKYHGNKSSLPVLQQKGGIKLPMVFISNFLRARYWTEAEYDLDSVSILAGIDDSRSLLSSSWTATSYLHGDFDLSNSVTLNTELGTTGFATANWYATVGLTFYQ